MAIIELRNSGIPCTTKALYEIKESFGIDLNDYFIGDVVVLERNDGLTFELTVDTDRIIIKEVEAKPEASAEETAKTEETVEDSFGADTPMPCPYCGGRGEAKSKDKTKGAGNTHVKSTVVCTECGAKGPEFIQRVDDINFLDEHLRYGREIAIDGWNRRSTGTIDLDIDLERVRKARDEVEEMVIAGTKKVKETIDAIDANKIKNSIADIFGDLSNLIRKG